jgi:ribonuclease Z
MKRWLLLMLVACVAVGYVARVPLAERILPSLSQRIMAQTPTIDDADALHVLVCGAGGPLADPVRSGPCIAVWANGVLLVFDAGSGGARNLMARRLPIGETSAVFLTHVHSDHIDGLGELALMRWVNQANTTPLPVLGPPAVESVVAGFNQAYAIDAAYRQAHHGDTVAPLSGRGMTAMVSDVPAAGEITLVWRERGVSVEMFAVDHSPVDQAVGYRVSYAGRRIVISGDTAVSQNLQHFAEGADVLFHEALSARLVNMLNASAQANGNEIMARVTADILDYHTTPVEAAAIARDARVGALVYYHVVPALIAPGMGAIFEDGVAEVFANYTVSQDGTQVTLPANTAEIQID